MGLILGKIWKKTMGLPSFSWSSGDTVGRDGEKVEELILFWLVKYWDWIMCVDRQIWVEKVG
jgi:hypothetical protein